MKISIEATAKEMADLIKELNQPHNVNVDNFVKTLKRIASSLSCEIDLLFSVSFFKIFEIFSTEIRAFLLYISSNFVSNSAFVIDFPPFYNISAWQS